MKIYRERQTATHFIFEIRPYQLFDLSRSNEGELHPERREATIDAWNNQTSRPEVFAIAKGKGFGLDRARSMVDHTPDRPEFSADAAALRELKVTH